jgi:putative flippase GtrA
MGTENINNPNLNNYIILNTDPKSVLMKYLNSMKALAIKFFITPTTNSFIQFFRYLFVGGFSAIIDIGSLYFLTNIVQINYLASAAVAFILGNITNYSLSTLWIFKSKGNKNRELLIFTFIGLTGLFWNEIIIWSLVEKIGIYYMIAKLISTALVLIWNFGMRKRFVF